MYWKRTCIDNELNISYLDVKTHNWSNKIEFFCVNLKFFLKNGIFASKLLDIQLAQVQGWDRKSWLEDQRVHRLWNPWMLHIHYVIRKEWTTYFRSSIATMLISPTENENGALWVSAFTRNRVSIMNFLIGKLPRKDDNEFWQKPENLGVNLSILFAISF